MIHPHIYIGLPERKQTLSRLKRKEADPDLIIAAACDVLNVDSDLLLSTLRTREYSEARIICVGLILSSNPDMTLKRLGNMLNRDHSTIIYNRETFNALYKSDKFFTEKVSKVLERV